MSKIRIFNVASIFGGMACMSIGIALLMFGTMISTVFGYIFSGLGIYVVAISLFAILLDFTKNYVN